MKSIFKKKTTDALGKIVSTMTEHELMEWPPPCWGYFYQPDLPNFPYAFLEKGNDKSIEK